MKISYKWLKNYVNTDKTPQELDVILTDTGLEVEGVEKVEGVKGGLQGVVVGQVVTCEKHPDADKLNVTTVNIGAEENLQIVCGAPNCVAGIKVVVATVGCSLFPSPDEPAFKIKKSKIRGVESFGMLCAEDELGLGKGHDGILILPEETKVGTPGATYFNLEDDYLIEIGLTPNRADAMGHTGVAKDLVAWLNVHEGKSESVIFPDVSAFKTENNSNSVSISVENEDCVRYSGTTISGVKIAPSPEWIQKALRTIGLSPINNVVDITNFVMHELGTPLHAFDSRVVNGNVVIKKVKEGEKFTTLDGEERTLSAENLMITNGSENMCIAGVFGGEKSGVQNDTTDIFLESAYFNPVSVRKTAKFHGMNTDSSFRFERGVDPNMVLFALKRAALLIKEIAGGEISMDIVDIYPNPIQNKTVTFSYDRCNKLIGDTIPEEKTNAILENLDIKILSNTNGVLELEIPAYRVDVTREADVIEEVLRIYGFNNVALPTKLNTSLSYRPKVDREKLQTVVSEFLTSNGANEMMNNSLTQSTYVEQLGGEALKSIRNVAMLNPLSNELDVMRQTLVFNTLESVAHNQNRQNPDLKLYEFGKIYHKFEDGYAENSRLIIAISGKKEEEQWNSDNAKANFYTLKGLTTAVFSRLGLEGHLKEKSFKTSLLEDGVQLAILKTKVGEIGWINAKTKKHFGIKQDVFIADLDWDAILDSMKMNKIKYTELPKTFEARRDFSLLLDKKVSFAEIEEIAKKADKKILKDINLFDVYEGEKLEEGKKSYAVSFKFQDAEKTLKDAQIDGIMNKIQSSLENQLGAQLR